MKLPSLLLALTITLALFLSCGNHDDPDLITEIYIQGTVKDAATGKPIANAEVTLSFEGKTLQKSKTNGKGAFSFPVSQDGNYKLFVQATGYRDAEKSFPLTNLSNNDVDINMTLANSLTITNESSYDIEDVKWSNGNAAFGSIKIAGSVEVPVDTGSGYVFFTRSTDKLNVHTEYVSVNQGERKKYIIADTTIVVEIGYGDNRKTLSIIKTANPSSSSVAKSSNSVAVPSSSSKPSSSSSAPLSSSSVVPSSSSVLVSSSSSSSLAQSSSSVAVSSSSSKPSSSSSVPSSSSVAVSSSSSKPSSSSNVPSSSSIAQSSSSVAVSSSSSKPSSSSSVPSSSSVAVSSSSSKPSSSSLAQSSSSLAVSSSSSKPSSSSSVAKSSSSAAVSSSSSKPSSSSNPNLCAGFVNGTKREHYGKEKEQFCDPRDGKKYVYVKIGEQTWMAENLSYNASGSKCGDESTGTLSNENTATCDTYGRLYDWYTAIGLTISTCPQGWHLPSNTDWNVLIKFINPSCSDNSNYCAGTGTKLKSASYWNSYSNVPLGTDAYGFSALPGGGGGSFGFAVNNFGYYGYWWSSSEDANYANSRIMRYDSEYASYGNNVKGDSFSVRCIKD